MITLFSLAFAATMMVSAGEVRDRVARFTPVVFGPNSKLALAGRYTLPSKELRHRIGPQLSGEFLHLFADGTYLHIEWTDVSRPAIDDKGSWQVANNLLTLQPDKSIRWKVGGEHQFIVLRRPSRTAEVLLLGVHRQRSFFESEARRSDDREFLLLITTLALEERYTASRGAAMKSQLMHDAWNPKFFSSPK